MLSVSGYPLGRKLQTFALYLETIEIWSMIGFIPMIGLNDSAPEVFTLDDASTVVSYAQERHTPDFDVGTYMRQSIRRGCCNDF